METPIRSIFGEDADGGDLFYFESDHLALKGNKEYSEVLKTLFVLEAQRTKASKDYDKVVELHKQALEDPYSIIQKIKNEENLGVPELQRIIDVPTIHWSKYKVQLPQEAVKFINNNKKSNSTNNSASLAAVERDLIAKSDTYNKPWTVEEQKRLEELLAVYPPEPIEFQRFKKIATALGNRTVKQVSSRVQKYFLKLFKAGLPIPGRIPKNAERSKRSKLHTHQRHNHYLFKPTTFFPQLDIPVVMNESEIIPGPSKESTRNSSFVNYLMPESTHSISEPVEQLEDSTDAQLELLRKVKIIKQTENTQTSFVHDGYRCDYCNETPITGTRWSCQSCKHDSVNFCTDCVISQLYSGNAHPFSHKLEPIRRIIRKETMIESSNDSTSGSIWDSSILNAGSSNEDDFTDNEEDYQNFNSDENFEQEDQNNDDQDDEEGSNNDEDNDSRSFNINDYSVGENDSISKDFYKTYDADDHDTMETDVNEQDFEADIFTDTQNVAYSYLHSNMFDDNDTL